MNTNAKSLPPQYYPNHWGEGGQTFYVGGSCCYDDDMDVNEASKLSAGGALKF